MNEQNQKPSKTSKTNVNLTERKLRAELLINAMLHSRADQDPEVMEEFQKKQKEILEKYNEVNKKREPI